MRFKFLIILFIWVAAITEVSAEIKPEDTEVFLERAAESSRDINLPQITPEMLKKIMGLKNKVDTYQNSDISSIVLLPDKPKKENLSRTLNGKHVWLLVSTSIPESTLRNYIADIDRFKLPITILIRGLVGDDMKQTVSWMTGLLKKKRCKELTSCRFKKANISIDPRVFRYYEIEKVPALIVGDPNQILEGFANESERNKIVYGDASIEAMLNKLESSGFPVQSLLEKMKGRSFHQ